MGFAERKVEEIRQRRDHSERDREWQLEVNRIGRENASPLWDATAKAIVGEVEQFSKLEPSAKHLQVSYESPTHLLVHTKVFPVVKLNICKVPGGIQADLVHIKHSLGTAKSWPTVRLDFSADSQLKPCLKHEESECTPEQAAEALLDNVFSLFG